MTSIGRDVFTGCVQLTSITIPDGVTSIGIRAFYYCSNLTSITLSKSLTSIELRLFDYCERLTSVTIPDSVTSIEEGAFADCRSLRSITIPDSVTSIESGVFYECNSLTSITIPDSVTSIGERAFVGCKSLISITIPGSVTSIGSNAFERRNDGKYIDVYTVKESTADQYFTSLNDEYYAFNIQYPCDPSGHKYGDWIVVTEPTCKQAGKKERRCTICGNKESDSLPATKNHTWNNDYTVDEEPTCDVEGIESIHCSVCGESDESTTRVIPKREHIYGEWAVETEPSCVDSGKKVRACSVCGNKETETIPAPGHTWSKYYTVDKEPNQTEAGSESIHCTVCDAIDEASIRVIPKLGFSVDADFVLEKPAFNYTGKPIEPGVTVTYNGKQLVRDKDYKVTYKNNIDLGQADVDVTGIGKYAGTEHLHFTIRIGAPKKVTCTNVVSGMKVSWTKVNGATRYKVYRDGKYIFTTSALEVTDKEVRYKGGTKYVYKVVATEKRFGDSEFYKTGTCYRLMPVGIKSLTNPSAGKMTVTYDKSAGCYGYVVRYGLKADMSDANVVTVQGQNTTSRTLGGMKKGKTYYVQVRVYKLDNGVRYYSGYCTTKTITIKK